MGSRLVRRTNGATIRIVTSEHGDVCDGAVDSVFRAVVHGERLAAERKLDVGHVFVTIVAGDCVEVSEDEVGAAMYQQGIDSIVVAGIYPEGVGISREDWLAELFCSTVHEYVHHIQHLEGRLGGFGDEAAEHEAELIALQATHEEFATSFPPPVA